MSSAAAVSLAMASHLFCQAVVRPLATVALIRTYAFKCTDAHADLHAFACTQAGVRAGR